MAICRRNDPVGGVFLTVRKFDSHRLAARHEDLCHGRAVSDLAAQIAVTPLDGTHKALAAGGEQPHITARQKPQHHEKEPERDFGQKEVLHQIAQRGVTEIRGKLPRGAAVLTGEVTQDFAHAPELAHRVKPARQFRRLAHPDVERTGRLERPCAVDQIIDRARIDRREVLQRRGTLRKVGRQQHALAARLIHKTAVFRHAGQRFGRRRTQLAVKVIQHAARPVPHQEMDAAVDVVAAPPPPRGHASRLAAVLEDARAIAVTLRVDAGSQPCQPAANNRDSLVCHCSSVSLLLHG